MKKIKTVYGTNKARLSAMGTIRDCINAMNGTPGLPFKIGTHKIDQITKLLTEYRELIRTELNSEE